MTDQELPITGYLDRFSHRPSESFTAFVSVRDGGTYRGRLVRVLSSDPNPNGPGVRFEDLSHLFDRSLPGRRQAIRLGSYGIVAAGPARDAEAACTWTVLVRPALQMQVRSCWPRKARHAGFTLFIGEDGATARIASAGATVVVAAGAPIQAARWYRVWLGADPVSGRVVVGQQALDGAAPKTAEMLSPVSPCRRPAHCCWQLTTLPHPAIISPASWRTRRSWPPS